MYTKVLIIDNDTVTSESIEMFLQKEGYEMKVAKTGDEGIKYFKSYDPDIILMEASISSKDGRQDGLQICREIRDVSNVPIIFISEKGDVIDKILGLESGADDYMVKPANVREVYARIKAIMRRARNNDGTDGELIKFENIEISLQKYELRIKDKVIELPPKELELLYFLAANCNRVYTRDQLLDKVWSFDYLGDSRTVDVHIKRLREKLEGASDQWRIETVWGVGYKFKVDKE